MPNLNACPQTSPASPRILRPRLAARARAALAGLWRDRRGAAAIEFVMVVPLLIGMYFGTMEVGQAVDTSRKLNRAAATIGLVATQQSGSVTAADLQAMLSLGDAAIQPYNRSGAKFTVSGVRVKNDASLTVQVMWSRSYASSAGAADCFENKALTIPDTLRTAGAFLVVTVAQLCYKPMIAWAESDKKKIGLVNILWPIQMTGTSYQVTRDLGNDISCSNC